MCICSDKCNLSVSRLFVVRCRPIWLCLPVVSIDLEEADAPSAVMCNISHTEPGNSIPLPVLTLCKQARPKRYNFRESGGGGHFLVSVFLFNNYVQGQTGGFKGKTNEVGFRSSC